MTKITILFICISLIVRFVYPQISFSREWVRNRSVEGSGGYGHFHHKTRKSSGHPSQWVPAYKNRYTIHENKKASPQYREFGPQFRATPYQQYIMYALGPHARRIPLHQKRSQNDNFNSQTLLVNKRSFDSTQSKIPDLNEKAGKAALELEFKTQNPLEELNGNSLGSEIGTSVIRTIGQEDPLSDLETDSELFRHNDDDSYNYNHSELFGDDLTKHMEGEFNCLLNWKTAHGIDKSGNRGGIDGHVMVSGPDLKILTKLRLCYSPNNHN